MTIEDIVNQKTIKRTLVDYGHKSSTFNKRYRNQINPLDSNSGQIKAKGKTELDQVM